MRTTTDVRCVQVEIEPEEAQESGPVGYMYDDSGTQFFQPRTGTVGVGPSGQVQSVSLIGPRITSRGKLVTTTEWCWDWYCGEGKDWPPPDAPPVALALVAHVLAAPTPVELVLLGRQLEDELGLRLTDEALAVLLRLGAREGLPSPFTPVAVRTEIAEDLADVLARELIAEPWPSSRAKTDLRMILAEATRRGWLLAEHSG